MKRMDAHCIFFDLGSDWDFSNIESVFNKKIDYKKVKTTFGPPLLPIKLPHWTPPLTNLRGGGGGGVVQTTLLLPMLEKEDRAQFYRDKNMWRNAAKDRVLLRTVLVVYSSVPFLLKSSYTLLRMLKCLKLYA